MTSDLVDSLSRSQTASFSRCTGHWKGL